LSITELETPANVPSNDSHRSMTSANPGLPSIAAANQARVCVTDVLSTTEAFDQLQAEWDALVDVSDQCSYFLRWHWNAAWWQHLAPERAELRIVCCRDHTGTLIGLAPLYLRRRTALGLPVTRELVLLGTGIVLKTSEYLDIVVRRGYESVAPAAMAAALNARDDWDRIWLYQVPSTSTVLQAFLAGFNGRSTIEPCDSALYVDTSRGWEDYKARLGRSMRRNVEYYGRRLFKRHACSFTRVESAEAFDRAFDALVRLHVLRWQSQGEIGTLSNSVFVEFLRDAMARCDREGRLRLWTLTIDGTIEAVLVGFLDAGIVHYFQKGYNPAFWKDDLGTAMVALCIRDCCDDDSVAAFDFMGGGAAYKAMWAREGRHTQVAEVSRGSVGALAFSADRWLSDLATGAYRALVPTRLRIARRDWLKEQRLRDHARRATQGLMTALSASLQLAAPAAEILIFG